MFCNDSFPRLLEDVPLDSRNSMRFMFNGASAFISLNVQSHHIKTYPNKLVKRGRYHGLRSQMIAILSILTYEAI